MIQSVIFLIILLIATYTDLKERKIYNSLIITSLIIGIGFCLWKQSLVPILMSMGIFMILLVLLGKAIGGGDIKLLSLVPLFVTFPGLYFFLLSLCYLGYYFLRRKDTKNNPLAPVIALAYIAYIAILTIK